MKNLMRNRLRKFIIFSLLTFILLFSYGSAIASSCYMDADCDGYGAGPILHGNDCNNPNPCVSDNNLDCDDTDPNIYPGATEICSDGKDNNCDGYTDELRVPESVASIQEAINQAGECCTIYVNDGTYYENIDFLSKCITLVSVNGPEVTIIDGGSCTSGNDTCSVVSFKSGETAASVLDGFTIRSGLGTTAGLYSNGGGIYCNGSSPTIKNCIIKNNLLTGYSYGGGVYAYISSPTFTNCDIISNTALQGAGIYSMSGNLTITTGSNISYNDSEYYGGGIYSEATQNLDIRDSFIEHNTSVNSGGGIFAKLVNTVTISNCDIHYNDTDGLGGGIAFAGNAIGTWRVENSRITNNNAVSGGGGIECDSSEEIINCVITDNTTTAGGGGIRCTTSSPTIEKCTIEGNTAAVCGGGVYFNFSNATITNCTISDNTVTSTPSGGGGIFCILSSPTINSCTISYNNVTSTGGGGGGGIYVANESSPTVLNSILWGDTNNSAGNEIYLRPGVNASINVTYSDVEGGWTGTGNINADPKFDSSHSCGPYHLLPTSPCIDWCPSGPSDDIDGEERPDSSGYVDIGADEYYSGTSCP